MEVVKMGGPKRTKFQRERDLAETARLYLRGLTQVEIAERLGVSQQQISKDLRTLRKRWQESALINMHEAKVRELARIDNLEREYWRSWEKSCARGNGNPTYLAGVQWCIERRCKILGIDAPSRREITGPNGGPVELKIVERIVRAED